MGHFSGMAVLRILSADLCGALDELCRSGICIRDSRLLSEVETEITVSGVDIQKIQRICEKRGDTVKILKNTGLLRNIEHIIRRPVLILFMMLYLVSALVIPSRVLFIRVVGNTSIPERKLLEAAEKSGIAFGASRREVRSEKVKNALLAAVPELQWAGVNTCGCVAEISVRERSEEAQSSEANGFGHIVAVTDGIITTCSATRGNLLCTPGQAVAEGDILVSGLTDCAIMIRAELAEGEIFALTRRHVNAIAPDRCTTVTETSREMKKISLFIGKKRINLWKDSGFWDASCDRMYEENYITLPGGFRLPFGWSLERSRIRELNTVEKDSRELLLNYAEQYLKDQLVALTIRDSEVSFWEQNGFLYMAGEYSCEEMIGIIQRLWIGEIHGKDNREDRQR